MTVFITLVSGLSSLIVTSADTYGLGVKIATLEGDARRALDRIADELMGAGTATFSPSLLPPFGAGSITFQKCTGLNTAGVPTWAAMEQIELVAEDNDPDDDEDNDGDGFVDEKKLVWRHNVGAPTATEEVLITGVANLLAGEEFDGLDNNGNGLLDEPGFSLEMSGGMLAIRLTILGRDPRGHSLERTVETSVVLRN